MLTQIECPMPAVVTLDELPANRTIKTVRDSNGVVWVSLSSVAVAAHSYPSRLTTNMRAMRLRPQMVDRQATNPTKRTKLETLTPVGHFYAVAANSTIGGTLYPDIRGPILTAIRDGVASLYDWVPIPAPVEPDPLPEPVVNRLVVYSEPLQNKEESNGRLSLPLSEVVPEEAISLVRVPFDGGDMLAHYDGETVWSQFVHLCETIGVTFAGQWQKVKEKPWMKTREMIVVAQDGKRRKSLMVDAESIPLWLATIDERRVKPEARPTLLKFELAAKKVLADYCF